MQLYDFYIATEAVQIRLSFRERSLEIEGLQVSATLPSLHCVLKQDTLL